MEQLTKNGSKTYRVKIEMDVTALDEENAIKCMVDDVVALYKDGSLDPVVTELSGAQDESDEGGENMRLIDIFDALMQK